MEYREVNETVFDTDLENELIKKGVSKEHISYLKEQTPKSFVEHHEYYERLSEKDQRKILVDCKKIMGIGRANTSASLYDNAAGKANSELNVYRMAVAINHIRTNTLDQLYEWYETLYDPVRLIYYSDEDVYEVGCDGNHRTLYAQIVGAPVIRANISFYKRSKVKYDAFLYFRELSSTYNFEEDLEDYFNEGGLIFMYDNAEYKILSYTNPRVENEYSKERLTRLAEELHSDWKHLRNKRLIRYMGKYRILMSVYLELLCKEVDQKNRLKDHIIEISLIHEEEQCKVNQ